MHHTSSTLRVPSAQNSASLTTSYMAIWARPPLPQPWISLCMAVNGDSTAQAYLPAHVLPQQRQGTLSAVANPMLIRTSALQQSSVIDQTESFGPYAADPSDTVLELATHLDNIAENWSREERKAKRRLVQFSCKRSGNTVYANFRAVKPHECAPNGVYASCIYWNDRDDCFVTSVDIIYLLEFLAGNRLTAGEKSRIRRSLESFKPLTISKAKADSQDFFKVIVGFSTPKPRTIAKDVKVFRWKILRHALKKIIRKCCMNPPLIADTQPIPLGPNYTTSIEPTVNTKAESQNAAAIQSGLDTHVSATYSPIVAHPVYFTPADYLTLPSPCSSESRIVFSTATRHPVAANNLHPAVYQQPDDVDSTAPASNFWQVDAPTYIPVTSRAPRPHSYYDNMASMVYPLQGSFH